MADTRQDQILIAGNQVGLERNVEPFLLPEGAYPLLENAFVFRERVKRRRGFSFLGRLQRIFSAETLTQTTAAGDTTNIADLINDSAIGARASEPNAEIDPGTVSFAVGADTWDDSALDGALTPTGGNAAAGTINYFTGAVTLNWNPATGPGAGMNISATFNYFPSLPVTGLRTREQSTINDEKTISFDTKYSYDFNSGAWRELPATTPTTWNGLSSDLFYTTNWRGATSNTFLFFATNFNQGTGGGDPIRYYDGTDWNTYRPSLDGVNNLEQALILLPFKGRLLAFNTWEGANLAAATNFQNRLRFSAIGNPTAANAFRSDIAGQGGFIDAPIQEAIVGADFIKDRLIVYFERSTWQIVYTGIETFPFTFQQLNTELGAESTFSVWPFDDVVLGVGNVGIHACNGSEVKRIDNLVPDEVFKIQNLNQGPKRVYAVRDYDNELVFWTYPDFTKYSADNDNQVYPNRVLVYNYRNGAWARFVDSFTCYGYFQRSVNYTWATLPYDSWADWTIPWNGVVYQGGYPAIVGGNQQGFTFLFDQGVNNEQSLTIQDLSSTGQTITVTSFDHNLVEGQYISFNDAAILGVTIAPVNGVDETYQVQTIVDSDSFTIFGILTGTYIGDGRITVHPNFRVATKRFNPYFPNDRQLRLMAINFFLDRTANGQFEAQLYLNTNTSDSFPRFTPFGVIDQGSLPNNRSANVVITSPETGLSLQQGQEKIWHQQRYTARGQFIEILMTLADYQMKDLDIVNSDWVLHALEFIVEPRGRLVP